MENLENKNKMDYSKKHVFTIKDSITGRVMISKGELCSWNFHADYSEVNGTYLFKTKDNESGVKEITLKKGKYKIEAMMRNKPIPSTYEVIGHDVEEMFSEEEKRKNELMGQIHTKLKSRCGMFGEYVHFANPIELDLKSVNKKIKLEYFTADWFGTDDIMNYQTDHVRLKSLSNEDLEYVYSKVF